MRITSSLVEMIKKYEGLSLSVYLCSAGRRTIGYGHVLLENENYQIITQQQALDILIEDISFKTKEIAPYINHATQNQYEALISLCFNIGITALKNSTLLACHNLSQYELAANEFLKWCYIGKKISQGLYNRRKFEMLHYLS